MTSKCKATLSLIYTKRLQVVLYSMAPHFYRSIIKESCILSPRLDININLHRKLNVKLFC